MRPLQGAAGHGALPRPQVNAAGRGDATLRASPFQNKQNCYFPTCSGQREVRGTENIPAPELKVTKEKRQRPLVSWSNPNSLVRASDVFAFCFSANCSVEKRLGRKEGWEWMETEMEMHGWVNHLGKKRNVFLWKLVSRSGSNNNCDNNNNNVLGRSACVKVEATALGCRCSYCHVECKKPGAAQPMNQQPEGLEIN